MKSIQKFLLMALFTVIPFALFAHADHGSFEPVTAKKAITVATGVVEKLIREKKIAKTWSRIKPSKTERQKSKKGPVWVFTFHNAKADNQEKNSLYVFIDELGNPITANFNNKLD